MCEKHLGPQAQGTFYFKGSTRCVFNPVKTKKGRKKLSNIFAKMWLLFYYFPSPPPPLPQPLEVNQIPTFLQMKKKTEAERSYLSWVVQLVTTEAGMYIQDSVSDYFSHQVKGERVWGQTQYF